MWIVHSGSLRYFRESSIPVVVEKEVASPLQASWTALYGKTVILAGFARTEFWKVIEMEVDVVGDEQVDPAIVVVVAESRTGCILRVGETCLLGDIRECAITIVAVENHSAKAGHQQVRP